MLLLVNTVCILAAVFYAIRNDIPAAVAVPVALAFLLEISIYCVAGFPCARLYLEKTFSHKEIASIVCVVSVCPYLIYAIPTGVFSFFSAAKLSLLCALIAGLFVFVPTHKKGLCGVDLLVLMLLAYPMVSGVSTLFREFYISPHPGVPNLSILGKMMLIPLGAIVFLSIRGVILTGFRFQISLAEFWVGVRNYIFFLLIGLPIVLATGFTSWDPTPVRDWTYVLVILGNILGIYLFVALGEELFFRGLIQNLLMQRGFSQWRAQLLVSILFGAVHLGRGTFPNWKYGFSSAVAGWFYGRAYSTNNSVPASAVTHTLVVLTWRFMFE